MPFFRVSLYAMGLTTGFSAWARASLAMRLLKLNVYAAKLQLQSEFASIFRSQFSSFGRQIVRKQKYGSVLRT